MIGNWFGRAIGRWLGFAESQPLPVPIPEPRPRRSRLMHKPRRYVEKELQTPDGPMIVLVPAEWTADDMLDLATALVLADALNH